MATAATALLDLADITNEERILLGIPTMTDPLMEIKINEASDWIERETQSKFVTRMVTEKRIFDEPMTKIFLLFRPLYNVADLPGGYSGSVTAMTITNPTGTLHTDPVSLDLNLGILYGNFTTLLNSDSLPAPWKIIYPAGSYLTKADIPASLKQACKLTLAWRWKINAQQQYGDYVPILIKQSLAGHYSAGAVVFW